MKDKFADYLRAYIHENWDGDVYKHIRQKSIWEFINGVLNKIPKEEFFENTTNVYIQTVKSFFDTNHSWEKRALLKKMGESGNLNKCKSIENFIHRATVPEINKLEQIAIIFKAPIKTYQEFLENCAENTCEHEQIKPENKLTHEICVNRNDEKSYFSTKRKLVIISSSVLFALVFVFAAFGLGNQQVVSDMQNDSLKFVNKILDQKFEVKQMQIKKLAVSQNKIESIENNNSIQSKVKDVKFETFRIYNNECITSDKPWNFDIDPLGEDMYSKKYGFPYCNTITLLKKSANQTPIANKKMIIRFKIINGGEKPIKISDFALNVDSVIFAVGENIFYNILQERGTEDEQIKIILNSKQTKYAFYNQIYEIKPDSEAFFILEIEFPKQDCTDSIYKFHFEIAFDDNTILLSDKKYFLACKNL